MTDTRTHVRLASKAAGDDTTFSRYVKTSHGRTHGKPRQRSIPGLSHPKIEAGKSFFQKSVKPPMAMKHLLVSGHSNVKIGNDVRIGKLKGYRIFTLSLEERATCPRACAHWQTCYGNSMPYAKRIDHTSPDFLPRLEAELIQLQRRKPILVRLHALGDFYDVDYVGFWAEQLDKFPDMVVFGYSAWLPGTPIGDAVMKLIDTFPGRAMLRFSNGGMKTRSTVPIVNAEDCPPGAFVCPEQTGQFEACGKCGACWATLKNVAFMDH